MEYVGFILIGMVAGLIAGRVLAGNNYNVQGDLVFGVIGALAFGAGLGATGFAPESGAGGASVMAAIGAVLALILRRAFKSV